MREKTRAVAAFAAVLSLPLVSATADAQADRGRPPVVSISTELGSGVATNYIEPSIRLSEDAYVFAILVDVDRNIQILHPDFPGLSVKMTSRKRLQLPSVFAGYGDPDRTMGGAYGRYASSSYYDSYDPGYADTRGTVIALASRRPFNLAALTVNGEWDFTELRRLVDGSNPHTAASALARHIGQRGEPIGRDVYRFAGAPRYYTSEFYGCWYGRPVVSHWGVDWFRAAQLQAAGYRVTFIGVDACGKPRYAVHGNGLVPGQGKPGTRPPATGAFPGHRARTTGLPRNPARDDAMAGRMASKSEVAQRHAEHLNATPLRGRSSNPHPVDRGQSRPATGAFPARTRAPERVAPPPQRVNPPPQQRPVPIAAPPRAAERPRQAEGARPVDK